jgi:hypothetical protein
MNDHEAAWLAQQRARWLRPDAERWIRPDAARFLKPGTTPADVFPALARKYRPDQPRIPAGQPGGGRWTDDWRSAPGTLSDLIKPIPAATADDLAVNLRQVGGGRVVAVRSAMSFLVHLLGNSLCWIRRWRAAAMHWRKFVSMIRRGSRASQA